MKAGKLFKRLLVCAMMVFVLGALSGCGGMSADEIMEKYAENNLSVDNCEATMKMEMEMGQDGSDETFKVSVDSSMQIMTTPDYKAYITMAMDMGELGNYDVDTYIMKDGDSYYTYMYSMDTWMKQALPSDDLIESFENYSDQIDMNLYIKNMKNFSLAGEETVGDKETYKIEGTISGDSLKEIVENIELAETAGVDAEAFDYSSVGDLPLSIWVSKDDFKPVKIYMDLSSMMGSIMSTQGLGVTVPVCTVEVEYTGFGTVTDIVLPEEAKNAVSLDDSLDVEDTAE